MGPGHVLATSPYVRRAKGRRGAAEQASSVPQRPFSQRGICPPRFTPAFYIPPVRLGALVHLSNERHDVPAIRPLVWVGKDKFSSRRVDLADERFRFRLCAICRQLDRFGRRRGGLGLWVRRFGRLGSSNGGIERVERGREALRQIRQQAGPVQRDEAGLQLEQRERDGLVRCVAQRRSHPLQRHGRLTQAGKEQSAPDPTDRTSRLESDDLQGGAGPNLWPVKGVQQLLDLPYACCAETDNGHTEHATVVWHAVIVTDTAVWE